MLGRTTPPPALVPDWIPESWALLLPGSALWALAVYLPLSAPLSRLEEALAAEARDGALLVFDLPETKQGSDTGGAAELMLRMGQMVGEVSLLPLATQRYFALDFSHAHASDQIQVSDNTAADNIKESMGTSAT